jgi:hypothetical protein
MPATSAPTDRQLAFFNRLLVERGAAAIENFAPGTTRREASEAIDGLLATPRPAAATAEPSGTETLPTPNADHRAGRMLLAGGIEATVTLPDGRHCTVTVRTRGRRGAGWANMAPGEEGARTNISILGRKVGWVNVVNGEWRLTLRTRRDEYRVAVDALFRYAAGRLLADDERRVQEASRCGRCFRTLTDPVSIDRGIGPECFDRDTGSQHIAADRDRNGTAVTREPAAPRVQTGRLIQPREVVETAPAERQPTIAELAAEMRPEVATPAPADIIAEALDLAEMVATPVPAAAPAPSEAEIRRARDIIAEALDIADISENDSVLALRVFDALKR